MTKRVRTMIAGLLIILSVLFSLVTLFLAYKPNSGVWPVAVAGCSGSYFAVISFLILASR